MRENQQMQQLFIQFVNYVWAPIHNILLTAPQLNISQKALGKLLRMAI
jgi:hypothetical protein